MLENTFIHLPGIGLKKERNLWKTGIRTWDDFTKKFFAQSSLFSDAADDALIRTLETSKIALKRRDFDFFAERLPRREHYRIALTDYRNHDAEAYQRSGGAASPFAREGE